MAEITHDLNEVFGRFGKKAQDYNVPLKNWYGYMLRQTALTFKTLGGKNSGMFRGVSWTWFADQYTRKDGSVMHAEGDGRVKGRLRHSGKRVKSADKVMQDRGILFQNAMAQFRIRQDSLIARTPVKYAKFQQGLRPFAFITEDDVGVLAKMIGNYLIK